MAKNLEPVDVVIVGSGAAGSVFAAILAESGKSVVVLERGVARKLTDLYSSQIWSRRLKWGSPHVVEDGPDSIWYNYNAGQGFGGAALHHFGVWPRMHPEDFRERTLYGRSQDWPFEYAALRPFYDQVQRDVGISGDAIKEVWRPAADPYPLPPIPVTNHGRTIRRGFDALNIRTSPMPLAILTAPYNGRPQCLWDGWCEAGCPIGALANPLVTYLPRAIKAGARMVPHAHVTSIQTDKSGYVATTVKYFDQKGAEYVQPATAIVLCAFTVENSRILLNSASRHHPNGLSNKSGMLGRYLMSHPAVAISGLFADEMENYLGVSGGQLFSQDAFPKKTAPDGPFGSRQWEIALALKPNDMLGVAMSRPDIFGKALHGFMADATRHMGMMVGVCEDEPLRENRIGLSDQKDRYGIPLARITYKMSPEGKRLWQTAAAEGIRIFKAAGARDAWHSPPSGQHIMGGTIMGRDPQSSVLNEHAQCHDVKNLFVGGPSVFPTSSSVNSTFTAHAVAMKTARFIVDNWSAFS
jgi:choline dehydrogenase-like flavoprotein